MDIDNLIQECNGDWGRLAQEMLNLRFTAEQLMATANGGKVVSDIRNHVFSNLPNYSGRDIYIFEYQGLFDLNMLTSKVPNLFSPDKRREYRKLKSQNWVPCTVEDNTSHVDYGDFFSNPINTQQQHEETQGDVGTEQENTPHVEYYDTPDTPLQPEGMQDGNDTEQDNREDKEAWDKVDKTNRIDVSDFIIANPQSNYYGEALSYLKYLPTHYEDLVDEMNSSFDMAAVLNLYFTYADKIPSAWVSKREFLDHLAEDHNLISAIQAAALIDGEVLTDEDFESAGFERDVIKAALYGLGNDDDVSIQNATQLIREATEFYFWGISGSGKSCALGAILSAANSGRIASHMEIDRECNAADYLERLRNSFKEGELGPLPPSTPVGLFAEMGFNLIEKPETKFSRKLVNKLQGVSEAGRSHPITCIDMAGGTLALMSKKIEDLTVSEQDIIDNLNNLLCHSPKGNHAQHFFIVEYKDEDVSDQFQQLTRALDQIENLGLFKKKTDHIWIMVTKFDKCHAKDEDELKKKLKEYIVNRCSAFYNRLKEICRINQIDGGEPRVTPFSIGDVELQLFCRFDSTRADRFVRLMLETPYK